MTVNDIAAAAAAIREAQYPIAFTGAGISVESGVPPFRGSENSVWSKYSEDTLSLDYFYAHPTQSWQAIKEIFYNFMFNNVISPNTAHLTLAAMEKHGMMNEIITQNIDVLHQQAGSSQVLEFHGTAGRVVCTKCKYTATPQSIDLSELPPRCPHCGTVLKPDFVFFGENIPTDVYEHSLEAARKSDLCIIVGTSGVVMPACIIPYRAKERGATIIEVNTQPTTFTERGITDLFLQGKAGDIFAQLAQALGI